MTKEEFALLTTEQKRIKIAEACGLNIKLCPIHHARDCCGRNRLPDYLNDLNAMHEAEKVLDQDNGQASEYTAKLHDVTKAELWGNFESVTATSAQRAEAFLRTIGKWE